MTLKFLRSYGRDLMLAKSIPCKGDASPGLCGALYCDSLLLRVPKVVREDIGESQETLGSVSDRGGHVEKSVKTHLSVSKMAVVLVE